MELLREILHIFIQLDAHLIEWTAEFGLWVYVILVTIVFCETGLVVTPFLPVDSLLFAVGALAAIDGSPVNVGLATVLLIAAGVAGDAVNYLIGFRLGPTVFSREDAWLFKRRHLHDTQRFYERHGGKTVILARFVPIARTFAPFVAGIGKMRYRQFAAFNLIGAVVWVTLFVGLGYAFGNLPTVKRNFQYVILAIVVLSVLPAAIEFIREQRKAKRRGV